MDAAQRAKLLRERLRAIRGYSLPAYPIAKGRKWTPSNPFRLFPQNVPVGPHTKEVPQAWIAEPDEVEPPITPKPRRVARKSPLIRIAELYPVRLPRRKLNPVTDENRRPA